MKNGIAIRVGVFIFVAMITVTSPGSTHAVTITGGSVLLDASAASQLQTWLGEIEIVLDKIFTATPGGGAVTNTMFHAAEDGKGRTFTVVSITSGAVPGPIIFGGYNPQSGDTGGWHLTVPDSDRTALIVNLSDNYMWTQRVSIDAIDRTWGASQPTLGGPPFVREGVSVVLGRVEGVVTA